MYNMITGTLKDYNERLWFTVSLRLAKMYFEEQNYEQLEQMLVTLKRACLIEASNTADLCQFDKYDLKKSN